MSKTMKRLDDSDALWLPDPMASASSPMAQFSAFCAKRHATEFDDYSALHKWSLENREAFWSAVWDYCGILGDKGDQILRNGDRMPGSEFFPDASLNFAENLLRERGKRDAIVFRGEGQPTRRLSWNELRELVSRLQQALSDLGVGPGDRVAAMLPNIPESVAAMLATASLGATWASCSPDFGETGVLDRFSQIEPKIFLACDGYQYGGKLYDVADKVAAIASALPVTHTLIVSYLGTAHRMAQEIPGAVDFDSLLKPYPARALHFARQPFSHPLYILFSSGTTGVPKCIVHSAGGTLIQHLKEQRLHCGLMPGERFFYFTTCGWMMWNWLVGGLACGATLCLYDGSPFHPDGNTLFDYAAEEKISIFGISAKFIDAVRNAELAPTQSHDLSSMRLLLSTGSPLADESFDFVYRAIHPRVHLASISGGTDIVSCFVLGIPSLPVWRGEIQGPGLGMAVDVWNEEGEAVREQKGELVCTLSFPSMPVMFWNDHDGKRYRAAYFERFEGVWCHGDFAEWTRHGGIIIHGRSDATLNPGGVRIGTAEIYSQVESMEEIIEALCIGQEWKSDVRIVLFVQLAQDAELTEELISRIKARIRSGASPRHVPDKILAVKDMPRTRSGKITELAVRNVVHGRAVQNKEALANPEALRLYEDLAALRD